MTLYRDLKSSPKPETQRDLLRVWEAWLSPRSRWLSALRQVRSDVLFYDWGGGLPHPHPLRPFCLVAEVQGVGLVIERVADLKKLPQINGEQTT